MKLGSVLLAILVGASAPAAADTVSVDGTRTTRKEGDYAGAQPGVRPLAIREGKGKPRAVRPGTLTWIGFAAKDRGAEVWLQSSSASGAEQAVEGQTLVVFLPGLTRQVGNTRRAIETRYFDNPLTRISARAVKKRKAKGGAPARRAGIEVRIDFKNPVDAQLAQLRVATEADGLHYTYLTFGPATDLPTTPAASGPIRDADLD